MQWWKSLAQQDFAKEITRLKADNVTIKADLTDQLKQKDIDHKTILDAKDVLEEELSTKVEALNIQAIETGRELDEAHETLKAKEETLDGLRSQAKTREKRIGELEADCRAKGMSRLHRP